MIISLDYDSTYTCDPEGWDQFIKLMRGRGHKVYCVTMRYETEAQPVKDALATKVDCIVCTGRRAKRPFMYRLGIHVSVWVDDEPGWILTDAADAVQKEPE